MHLLENGTTSLSKARMHYKPYHMYDKHLCGGCGSRIGRSFVSSFNNHIRLLKENVMYMTDLIRGKLA